MKHIGLTKETISQSGFQLIIESPTYKDALAKINSDNDRRTLDDFLYGLWMDRYVDCKPPHVREKIYSVLREQVIKENNLILEGKNVDAEDSIAHDLDKLYTLVNRLREGE